MRFAVQKEKSEVKLLIAFALLIANFLLFFCITVPLFRFSILGLAGRLVDAGPSDNRLAGYFFLVYAAISFAANAGMACISLALVWARRNRTDYCPICGYFLKCAATHGCPECGWNRPAGEGVTPSEDVQAPSRGSGT